ncbi:MAG TPA: hypothetical protein DET40_03320 [Lentisphaeria bacterium]|nr:MAG: hypothetical protein A2X45_22170 [Lentisphaerae bacterium GWF2_50_93]HCE42560.1 hypothetical protein [Lentisphaeria bacterium]
MDKIFLDKCIAELAAGKVPVKAPSSFKISPGVPEKPSFLWFRRNWTKNYVPVQKTIATLWLEGKFLNVFAMMEDSDVFTYAKGRNDQTWLKGDVLEFFFQPAGTQNYYELHVAPNLATLELSIPNAKKLVGEKYDFKSLFYKSDMKCETGTFKGKGKTGWWGLMKIPAGGIELPGKSGRLGRFAVCRYNYNKDGGIILQESASAAFPKFRFHDPDNWHELILP